VGAGRESRSGARSRRGGALVGIFYSNVQENPMEDARVEGDNLKATILVAKVQIKGHGRSARISPLASLSWASMTFFLQ
jgi:hypothetical protein